MGFNRTESELKAELSSMTGLKGELFILLYFSDTEIVKKLIPPPMEPARKPIVTAWVASYNDSTFGTQYREACLALRVTYKGREGNYCLAMYVDDDIPLILGREVFGYPKKMASITIEKNGEVTRAEVSRRGITFLRLHMEKTRKTPPRSIAQMYPVGRHYVEDDPLYVFKCVLSPDLQGFEVPPRLLSQVNKIRVHQLAIGDGKISLVPSIYDPVYEIPVNAVIGSIFTRVDIQMQPATVLCEVDTMSFLPHFFPWLDSLPTVSATHSEGSNP